MAASAWQYYAVKLVYRAVISGDPIPERVDEGYNDDHIFFEESVVLVHAQSFDHAYTIAQRRATEQMQEYTNRYGQTVTWELVDAVDCYSICDEPTDGIELFSSITPVKKGVTSSDYLMQKYNYNPNDYDWNGERRQECIRLQTVLTHEKFSKWRNTDSDNLRG